MLPPTRELDVELAGATTAPASRAVWVDLETAREQDDVARVMAVVLSNLDRVLVMLFDEADGLVGKAMVSLLTQLRQGYIERANIPFPASVVLVGQRQVRDYVLREDDRQAVAWLGTSSPFNITAEAMTLAAFTEAEVGELLGQHTAVTGQRFEPEAVARTWELAQGHPWLTNAIADQIVGNDVEDRSVDVTAAHVEAAKETLILERRSHIDSLVARLREPRVRRVLDPMIAGEQSGEDVLDDDFSYVMGLGLVRRQRGRFEIANPIYREVIPRALTYIRQHQIADDPAWYVRPDGALDLPKLMEGWQTFWRKDGHLAAAGFGYRESGPHLMLMAFLQRVVNGGGRVEREYGLGRGALDLLIEWNGERHAIEVKLRRDTETEADALEQVTRYLEHLGVGEGWLVMFDLRSTLPWGERLFRRAVEGGGRGCGSWGAEGRCLPLVTDPRLTGHHRAASGFRRVQTLAPPCGSVVVRWAVAVTNAANADWELGGASQNRGRWGGGGRGRGRDLHQHAPMARTRVWKGRSKILDPEGSIDRVAQLL